MSDESGDAGGWLVGASTMVDGGEGEIWDARYSVTGITGQKTARENDAIGFGHLYGLIVERQHFLSEPMLGGVPCFQKVFPERWVRKKRD